MNRPLAALLLLHRQGKIATPALLARLKELPYRDLRFAKVDLHRGLRRAFPEVIYGPGKSVRQMTEIARALLDHGNPVLITRISSEPARRIRYYLPQLTYFPQARILAGGLPPGGRRRAGLKKRKVLVVTAGTSDIRVGEEAAVTLEIMGRPVRRLFDVGVAGLHRLLGHLKILRSAPVIVVAAGMDGVLPSVISGLVAAPVVAVPTSAGYGASFKGIGPLLTMLNSCSPGVAVVNIDNGFGAGYLAARIAAGS